jgi:hypothetical protein
MTSTSPVTAVLRRRQLHKRSGFAVANALKEGARRLPPGPLRTFIAKKAARIETCAANQRHRLLTRPGHPSVIVSANSRACLSRDCMSCASRSAKAQARDIMDLMEYVWRLSAGAIPLMLTCTSRNQPLDQTGAMVIEHQRALKAFFAYDRIIRSILGQFGNIEIDFEHRDGRFFAHVHSHHIVMVEAGALSDHRYIRQPEWVALWQRALRVSYKPILDVRRIKSRDGLSTDPDTIRGGVREVCKYCLDSGSYVQLKDGNLFVDPDVAMAFAVAVHRRRLTSMTGIFAAAKKLRAEERKFKPDSSDALAE